jgi:hypothetical protein
MKAQNGAMKGRERPQWRLETLKWGRRGLYASGRRFASL